MKKKELDLFKGTVGNYNKAKVELKFKRGVEKRRQCKPYAVPEMHKKLMKEFLEDLVDRGVLRKAKSAKWLSPVFCQGKKDGGIRLLTDLRKLNEVLERDEWPLETIDSILNSMGAFNCITCIDQVMGYYAMQVKEEDQDYLGIITPWQMRIYNVLPQGLKIASDIFQREMVHLTENMDDAKVFIDDTGAIGK